MLHKSIWGKKKSSHRKDLAQSDPSQDRLLAIIHLIWGLSFTRFHTFIFWNERVVVAPTPTVDEPDTSGSPVIIRPSGHVCHASHPIHAILFSCLQTSEVFSVHQFIFFRLTLEYTVLKTSEVVVISSTSTINEFFTLFCLSVVRKSWKVTKTFSKILLLLTDILCRLLIFRQECSMFSWLLLNHVLDGSALFHTFLMSEEVVWISSTSSKNKCLARLTLRIIIEFLKWCSTISRFRFQITTNSSWRNTLNHIQNKRERMRET